MYVFDFLSIHLPTCCKAQFNSLVNCSVYSGALQPRHAECSAGSCHRGGEWHWYWVPVCLPSLSPLRAVPCPPHTHSVNTLCVCVCVFYSRTVCGSVCYRSVGFTNSVASSDFTYIKRSVVAVVCALVSLCRAIGQLEPGTSYFGGITKHLSIENFVSGSELPKSGSPCRPDFWEFWALNQGLLKATYWHWITQSV